MTIDIGTAPSVVAVEIDPLEPETGIETFVGGSGCISDYANALLAMPEAVPLQPFPTWVVNSDGSILATYATGTTITYVDQGQFDVPTGETPKTALQQLVAQLESFATGRAQTLTREIEKGAVMISVILQHLTNYAEIECTIATGVGGLQLMSDPVAADAPTQGPTTDKILPGVIF